MHTGNHADEEFHMISGQVVLGFIGFRVSIGYTGFIGFIRFIGFIGFHDSKRSPRSLKPQSPKTNL